MNNNAFEIQNQIKQNVLQMTNHIKNLKQWETEMRDKQPEENKEAGQEVVSEKPPIRSQVEEFQKFSASEDSIVKLKSMSITEDNKESEEQKSSAARKLEACDFKNKGNQFVKIKEHESAIKMYSRAIELNDKDPVFFSNRSQCYLSLEKYKECIEDTKKAIDLDPSSSKSYYRQMVAYEKLGDDFKALKSCRQWLDLSPEDSASKSSYDRIHNRIMEAERKKDKEKIRWSRLGSSAKVVNFINKPPHVASKRSLKKVPVQLRKAHLPFSESLIDKIFNNNTGENNIEPEIDSNPLFKPNFLLSSEPATKVAKLEVKKEKPIEEKKRDDEVNETLKKQEQEKEPLTLELECLHPIPQTGPQFYAVWKELNELDKFLFLKKISENKVEIGKLTGPQLSSEILSEIINIVYKYFKIHKVPYIPMLNKLIKNPEIAMLSMFLENDEKSKLGELLVSSGGDNETNNEMTSIKKSFGI